ncbi:MAG TPA: SDR family oxidoreductase, partial [Blastocatellia bacterium]|nr:SDR family oxidoreductase [Blastocatellia bacterium]
RGLPVSIYRPGRIAGDSRTGISNPDDFVCRYLRGCLQLGAMPDWDGEVNLVPVDYVSRAIVHLSMQPESLGRVFHLMNPRSAPWSDLIDWFRSEGFSVRPVPYRAWRESLERSPDNALYPLLSTFPADGYGDGQAVPEVSSRQRVEFDTRNTVSGLAHSSISCPPADRALFRAYLSDLVDRNVL